MKRRSEITIESERIFMVSRRRVSVVAQCSACGERVKMVTPDEAASIAGLSSRTIYRRIEAARVHFIETAEGLLLVCINSLSD